MFQINKNISTYLRSYSLIISEFMPAAKMSPSGSNAATGRPPTCIMPWQLGERRSHSRRDLSIEPEMKVSSMGLMLNVTTLRGGGEGHRLHISIRLQGDGQTFLLNWSIRSFHLCVKSEDSCPPNDHFLICKQPNQPCLNFTTQ